MSLQSSIEFKATPAVFLQMVAVACPPKKMAKAAKKPKKRQSSSATKSSNSQT
jgi:hypothetical protein